MSSSDCSPKSTSPLNTSPQAEDALAFCVEELKAREQGDKQDLGYLEEVQSTPPSPLIEQMLVLTAPGEVIGSTCFQASPSIIFRFLLYTKHHSED